MLKRAKKSPFAKISCLGSDEIYSVDCSPSWASLSRSSNRSSQSRFTFDWLENRPQVDLSNYNQFSEEKSKGLNLKIIDTGYPIFAL